ncbi:hypothetical protein AVEN_205379-1 [Araneus ventricosus]|uniref:Uncharacterized protein n=1 Tax=Araneus ventricosus TaxID=182803 RepID=A0A4Y2XCF0_ARAVE|nr:hypothetical protein AVEN_119307-1 [Araneus ventricosus]GBO46929.1 hypothetical protein AVEN_144247-1 [Araneus ventricosus]GBO46931.1 hypothetical protein AVEN_155541-1 [Araneus ventricosus]GBO46935.1 hypothetical protein AVEN_205379-1 [Araneus ventricosus]
MRKKAKEIKTLTDRKPEEKQTSAKVRISQIKHDNSKPFPHLDSNHFERKQLETLHPISKTCPFQLTIILKQPNKRRVSVAKRNRPGNSFFLVCHDGSISTYNKPCLEVLCLYAMGRCPQCAVIGDRVSILGLE